ncbi:MAG: ABC transporter permease [Ktedonobacterales bacterium]|nr:ABC transporter permease [Ktedonobacterales bacterium]
MPPKDLQQLLSQVNTYLHNKYIWDASRDDSIPRLFLAHMSLVGWSLLISILIAFPIALLIIRFTRIYLPAISVAGLLYTVPSIVMFSLLVPITGLTETTAIIPLVLYSQIVLIRNFVAALRAVDPVLQDVGRGLGMSEIQLLVRVTLPLALPVIIAGLRVATVSTIALATIAPLVSYNDLGSLIFKGFQPYYPAQLVVAAFLITAIALVADALLLGVQRLLSRGRTVAVAQ